MAQALRKLLRHSDHHQHHHHHNHHQHHDGERGEYEKGGGGGGSVGASGAAASPGGAARRLLARACSSVRRGYREATAAATNKVVPAEKTIPMMSGTTMMTPSGNNNTMMSTATTTTTTTTAPPIHSNQNNQNKKGNNGGGGGGALSRASSFFKSKKNQLISESTLQHAKLVRSRRLMKEFQEMSKQQRESDYPIFTVELVDDNLFEWHVKLFRVDPESELYRDMQETGTPYILLNLTFPDNFPFAPPFMRVITPRIERGFVMEGGAICMELLTPRGWASAYTIEAVLMQFAASLVKGQGRIARKTKGTKEFNKKSAEASFRSLVKTHERYGWVAPPLSDG